MTAIEQAETLRLQAVQILTAERDRIDAMLAQLGNEKAPKKRGPKPKIHPIPFDGATSTDAEEGS